MQHGRTVALGDPSRSIAQIEMLCPLLPRFQSDHAALCRAALTHADRVLARLQRQLPRSALLALSIDPNVTPGRNRYPQFGPFHRLRRGRPSGGFSAAPGDDGTDVEYTYYGLGALALVDEIRPPVFGGGAVVGNLELIEA